MERTVNDAAWEERRAFAPAANYRAGSGANATPEEILERRVQISFAIAVASFFCRDIWQNADLAALPACANLAGRNGIGDFIGSGRRGLKLRKFATTVVGGKRDFRIPPGPWQTWKCWDWLRVNAHTRLESLATEMGFSSAAEAEAEILARVDTAIKQEQEPEAEAERQPTR